MRFRLTIHCTRSENKFESEPDFRHEFLGNAADVWFLWYTLTNLGYPHVEVFSLDGRKLDPAKGINEMIDYNI